ncbi:MAG: DUF4394 domain-containing protein [Leptolyngbyaceae cyanobacterium RU_5_1]|nr:DUF4394 domain-containing protein [Leptolyngbyaceae cyanobacterium RU_5_1]
MRHHLSATLTAILATLTVHQLGIAQPVSAAELIGLTSNNMLVSFNSDRPMKARQIKVSGVEGTLIGIDFRPANRMLYGVTDSSKIYTINPMTGMATMVSALNTPFTGGVNAGVDFNPVADRLRLVGSNGQNFRINVETGAVTVDGALAYSEGDRSFGKMAGISAGAYTNSVAGTKATQLFNIDSSMDALVLQNPPNDGKLKTIGMLGTNFGATAGIDIMTDATGMNWAVAVSGPTLYSIDLEKGAAKMMGRVSVNKRPVSLIDVAAVLPPAPSATMPKPSMMSNPSMSNPSMMPKP